VKSKHADRRTDDEKNPPNVRVESLPYDLEDLASHDDCEEDLPAFVHKPSR
jgi:hypothetical protein